MIYLYNPVRHIWYVYDSFGKRGGPWCHVAMPAQHLVLVSRHHNESHTPSFGDHVILSYRDTFYFRKANIVLCLCD